MVLNGLSQEEHSSQQFWGSTSIDVSARGKLGKCMGSTLSGMSRGIDVKKPFFTFFYSCHVFLHFLTFFILSTFFI